MAKPSNGGGTRSGRCVAGPSAKPPTCSGWFGANAGAITPPSECPTISGHPSLVSRQDRRIVRAWALIVADARFGRLE
jgi:hypothetical protein